MATGEEYKDRIVGLIVFGVILLILGLGCAILVPLMILGMLAGAAADPSMSMDVGMMIPGVMVYVVMAVWFIWLGIGSTLARRWARTVILVSSWIAFIAGLGGLAVWFSMAPGMFAAMSELSQLPPQMARGMEVVLGVVMACIYVVGPGSLILFYRSRHVKATCEARDRRIRWTDRCPPHVLALSFLFWMWSGSLVMMCGYNFAVPFFGCILTGGAGALLVVVCMTLCGWWGWGLYRVRTSAWWGALIFSLTFILSTVITFSRISLLQYYEAMNFPAEQMEMLRAMDIDKNVVMGTVMLAYAVGFIAYVIYTRRFFPDGAAAFVPHRGGDPVPQKAAGSARK